MTNTYALNAIIDNYINGNLTDFSKSLHNISKLDIMALIHEWANRGEKYIIITNNIRRGLE